MKSEPLWAVFISGRGSNLQAILRDESVRVGVVVSSRAKAPGILHARRAGVPVWTLPKDVHWQELDLRLRQAGVSRICLAGFMKLLPAEFVERWRGRIMNIHPSLLPHYPGLRSIENAHADKAPVGITVHEVIAEMDAGPILAQRLSVGLNKVASLTLSAVEFYVHVDEQRTLPEVMRLWPKQPKS